MSYIEQRFNYVNLTQIMPQWMSWLKSNEKEILGRIINFRITTSPPYMLDMAKELTVATKEVNFMITRLNNVKADKSIIDHCRNVSESEHRVDEIHRKAVGELFDTKDVVTIIKMKEIYDALETTSDRCQDVADSIEDIVLKYT